VTTGSGIQFITVLVAGAGGHIERAGWTRVIRTPVSLHGDVKVVTRWVVLLCYIARINQGSLTAMAN